MYFLVAILPESLKIGYFAVCFKNKLTVYHFQMTPRPVCAAFWHILHFTHYTYYIHFLNVFYSWKDEMGNQNIYFLVLGGTCLVQCCKTDICNINCGNVTFLNSTPPMTSSSTRPPTQTPSTKGIMYSQILFQWLRNQLK